MTDIAKRAIAMFKRVDLHEKYQAVFESPSGQEVLDHILEVGYVFKTTAHSDPQIMAQREGMRTLALAILRHIYRDHGEIQRRVQDQVRRMHEDQN